MVEIDVRTTAGPLSGDRRHPRLTAPVVVVLSIVLLVGVACGPAKRVTVTKEVLDARSSDVEAETSALAPEDGSGRTAEDAAGGDNTNRRTSSPTNDGAGRSGGASTGVTGPGITKDTIRIGLGWFDAAAVGAAVAPGNTYSGSTKDAADAVVRYLNKRGGLAGRKIEPLYHEYPAGDLTTKSGRDRREQAMCADWTEDRRAFAAVPIVASQGVLYDCAARSNLPIVVGGTGAAAVAPVDLEWFKEIGHAWYAPHTFIADRREAMFVDQLHKSGFFPADAKVGLVLWDSPPARRAAERVMMPAFAARGIEVVATSWFIDPFANDWPNAVLRFQTAGVTHVVWGTNGCGGVCSAAFMNASESQGYRPFNALSSDNAPSVMADLAPAAQRQRILAIGWTPQDAGGAQYEAAPPTNANDARCREAKKESGLDLDVSTFATYCDSLFFIQSALHAASALNKDAFQRAVEATQFSFAPVSSWAVAFGPRRHDGPNAVRNLRYAADCECFRFSSDVRSLG